MSVESNLQSKIRQHLKDKGCYVIVLRGGPGVPDGCTDIIFMLEGFWGGIEVKDSPTAPYQPLQKETIAKFNAWSWARRVDPSNWEAVKGELDQIL